MAAVEIPRVLQGHVTMTMEEGVTGRANGVEDLAEEELGIYEDNAECADLTDSEMEDIESSQPLAVKPTVLGSVAEGISVIREEEEPESDSQSDTSAQGDELHLKLDGLPESVSLEEMALQSSTPEPPAVTNLHLPEDLQESVGVESPESRVCPGVRAPPDTAPSIDSIPPGDKTLVSFSNEDIQLDERPGSASTTELHNLAGVRGKANTPVSYLAETPGGADTRAIDSREVSRMTGVESREAIYRQAMNLMSRRCVGKQAEASPWRCPFGIPDPEYFYVEQSKPVPMPPLKAWRGYNGNVYFEPIQVNPMKANSTPQESDIVEKPNSQSRQSLPGYRGAGPSRAQPSPFRSSSLPSNPVKLSTSIGSSDSRQMSVLDKRSVINRFNPTIQEDLVWIEGQENTGTLAVNTRRKNAQQRSEPAKPARDRLCKGLVSHKNALLRKKLPQFAVSGDKFTPPPAMSPLLRTLTQYSLSTARVTTNSPEHGYEKLPPLEHLKATLRSINNSNEDPFRKPGRHSRNSALREEYKPLVKYSPDIKAKYEKHRGKMT